MFIRTLLIVVLMLFGLSTHSKACEKYTPSAKLNVLGLSQYVTDGGRQLYGKAVVQSDITVGLPCGFYGGAWWSTDTSRPQQFSSGGDEVDLFLGWSKTFRNGMFVDVSVWTFDVPPTFMDFNGHDGGQLALVAGWVKKLNDDETIVPYAAIKPQFSLRSGFGGEVDLAVGIRYERKLDEKIVFRGHFVAFYDEDRDGDGVLVPSIDGHMGWKLGEGFELRAPFVRLIMPLERRDGRDTRLVVGAGISTSF